ncbi:hypothetical protein NQ318_005851 [Aromia moschata]|uniref:Uncharacterized protein n=1 Tax=Aromia moschata TaxID=1265417 RepID=A0AAV8YRT2_9CUCU|nr:hypothetical protein NQ318_005851 [Aromia moschata]
MRGETPKLVKRKVEPDQATPQPRKSLRIDHNQKKAVEAVEKERKAFEAEEKLKKLAEKADLAKKKLKLSIAQKILKSKPVNLKKKDAVKKPLTKQKIQMVLEGVRKSVLPRRLPAKEEAPPKAARERKKWAKRPGKAKAKVVASKASKLQRQSSTNASQRQRNAKVVGKGSTVQVKKPTDKRGNVNKEKDAGEVRGQSAPASQVLPKKGAPAKGGANKKTPSVPVKKKGRISKGSTDAPGPLEVAGGSSSQTSSSARQTPKKRSSVKVKDLRKRIQQKTESLRKNVMRREPSRYSVFVGSSYREE